MNGRKPGRAVGIDRVLARQFSYRTKWRVKDLRAMVQEQSSRIGRRLAAIVAADVAGYSRLMGLDEVGTARILRR